MYPVIRLLSSNILSSFKSSLELDAVGEIKFICRPWDLDMYLEMNNGRIVTLYDLGRFDLGARVGLRKAILKNGWGLAVAGSSVRYRKRVRLFDVVTMRTQLAGLDDKWVYMAQSMWVKGKPTSSILLRTCVTSKGRCLPTQTVLSAIGYEDWSKPMPEWASNWSEADMTRPWPPQP